MYTYEPYYVPAIIISILQTWKPRLRKLGCGMKGDLPRGPIPGTQREEREAASIMEIRYSVHLLRS